MGTIQRGKIIRDDLANWDGTTATASRADATGGTVTGLTIGNAVDVAQVYGSGSRTLGAISAAVQSIGSTSVTLVFVPGTWAIDDDFTIPSNFTCHIPAGCIFDVDSGKTLTFSGYVIREAATWTAGTGTVTNSLGAAALIDIEDSASNYTATKLEAVLTEIADATPDIVEDTTPQLGADLECQGFNLQSLGVVLMKEQASADSDVAGEGQFWVKSDTPNTPYFTDDTGKDQIIDPSISTINEQNGNYTLVLGDKGNTISKVSGGAGETITIPANSAVAFPIGTLIGINNDGGGILTVDINTDTLTWSADNSTGNRSIADGGAMIIHKVTATAWKCAGSQVT